ncbi:MAG: DUF255 domain-containing protein [Acidaminobacteraceae bacterium]
MIENSYINNLVNETSMYLKTHSNSPINWYPWGEEAFEKAKKESKLVFLSIGYSSCHWCHVMNLETFSSAELAEVLNENFVSILIDREEHYDIDTLYMNAAFISNGKGGWPLNVILTPDLKPFYLNMYMSKAVSSKGAGFINVIEKSAALWSSQKERIIKVSNDVHSRLFDYSNPKRGAVINEKIFSRTLELLFEGWDEENGGMMSDIKFPAVHNLFFLLNHGGQKPLEYTKKQIDKMLDGGIYDRLEGGFHRYTNDKQWRIPHFDKHLHDQASMLGIITELYLYTDDDKYRKIADKLLKFIEYHFLGNDNMFFTSIDSDVNSSEGRYYLWDYQEIEDSLNSVEFEYAKQIFNLSKMGNYDIKNLENKNILYIDKDPLTTFLDMKVMYNLYDYDKYEDLYDDIIEKLSIVRKSRKHGAIDHKILFDLNTYAGAAMMYYARVFNSDDIYETCQLLHGKLIENFVKEDYIIHCYRSEDNPIYGTLTDYSYYMLFLINMYQYKGDFTYINEAVKIMNTVIINFWDELNYGFFDTDIRVNNVPMRYKKIYNTSVVPSNAIVMNVLIKLYEITKDNKYFIYANNMGVAFSNAINKTPLATISIISSLSKIKRGSYVVSLPGGEYVEGITKNEVLRNTPFDAVIKYGDINLEKTKNVYLKLGNKSVEAVETSNILRNKFFNDKT